MKLKSMLGFVLLAVVVAFVVVTLTTSNNGAPRMSGGSARLPCLANNHCPMGQTCSSGFCSEGFTGQTAMPAVDMSSCTAKECKGLNATCSRKEAPCPEGTFCQNDACVTITAQDLGEAYSQIGMLLD